MSFRSIGPLENVGGEAGPEGTLNWQCWKGRKPIDEASASAIDVLPLRQSTHSCPRLCPTCYTLRRQDEMCFGGLGEAVFERDGYRCRVCPAPGRRKRSILVHHLKPDFEEIVSLGDEEACEVGNARKDMVVAQVERYFSLAGSLVEPT